MRHIDVWKAKVRAQQAARAAENPQRTTTERIWDGRRAAWFNRFAGQSDRSDTYRFFAPLVRGQVLEVGPGPGAYTRLLLEQAEQVVTVEPSVDMIVKLRANLPDAPGLEIVHSSIEDYIPHLEHYDLALAANVLSSVERIDEVLGAVADHSEVLAIVMWSSPAVPAWSQAVQRELLGREAPMPLLPAIADLLGVLEELGITYAAHRVDQPIHTFAAVADVVDWVEGYLNVPPERHAELARIVSAHVSEQDGKFGLESGRETVVVLAQGR